MIFLDAIPPDLHTEYVLMYEARAIHDTASLQLSDYGLPARPLWIVAIVEPEKGSGSATVPGAYVDPATGRAVSPGGAAVVAKKGKWKAAAAADGSLPRAGDYYWTEPLEQRTRALTAEHFYSPFAYGGTILFRPELNAQGLAQFAAARLLFSEWEQSAIEALRGGNNLSDLFTRAAADPAALADVAKLALSGRGVMSTLAFRSLLANPAALAPRAPILFQITNARVLSTFVYLSLVSPTRDRSAWALEIGKLVGQTKEPDRLLAIAHGAFAATLFGDPAARASALEIVGALRKRTAALGTPLPQNSPLFLIFKKSGYM
jgi:hypothetical protein